MSDLLRQNTHVYAPNIPDISHISTSRDSDRSDRIQKLRKHLLKLPHIIDIRLDTACEEFGLDFSDEILLDNPHLSSWSISPAPSSWISRTPLAICGPDIGDLRMANFINSLLHNITFFTMHLRRLRYEREK